MKRKHLIPLLFLFSASFAVAQSAEQTAFDYLVENIAQLSIKHTSGNFVFDKTVDKIFYLPETMGERKTRIRYDYYGYRSTIDAFYKVVHETKDIMIITQSMQKEGDVYAVKFDILTPYDLHTYAKVLMGADFVPMQLVQTRE